MLLMWVLVTHGACSGQLMFFSHPRLPSMYSPQEIFLLALLLWWCYFFRILKIYAHKPPSPQGTEPAEPSMPSLHIPAGLALLTSSLRRRKLPLLPRRHGCYYSFLPLYSLVVGRIKSSHAPKKVHVLILRHHNCGPLHGNRDFADMNSSGS